MYLTMPLLNNHNEKVLPKVQEIKMSQTLLIQVIKGFTRLMRVDIFTKDLRILTVDLKQLENNQLWLRQMLKACIPDFISQKRAQQESVAVLLTLPTCLLNSSQKKQVIVKVVIRTFLKRCSKIRIQPYSSQNKREERK